MKRSHETSFRGHEIKETGERKVAKKEGSECDADSIGNKQFVF